MIISPHPIITPSTKAEAGHDEDISKEEIIAKGIVKEKDFARMEEYTHRLFEFGKRLAAKRGLYTGRYQNMNLEK